MAAIVRSDRVHFHGLLHDCLPALDLEVDDDLALHVPAGLEFGRGADLLDREARRDRHPELARRNQAGDLFQGAGDGVRAIGGRHAVDLRGDGADTGVRDAEFPCGVHCLRPVQVDGGGDAGGSEGPDPVGQAVAVGTGSAPRPRRKSDDDADPVPITCAPASRASWTANTPTPPAAPPISTVSPGPGSTTARAAAAVRPAIVRVAALRSSRPSGV